MSLKLIKGTRNRGAAALAGLFLWLLSPPTTARAAEEIVWTGERSIYYSGLQDAAHEFTRLTKIKVTAIPGGCGAASAGVKSGKVDVGGLCCAIKEEELSKFGFKHYPIGIEGLAIVVHPSNPVKSLTQQQVRDILTGKITNWKEVGEKERPIKVVARPHCTDREGNWKQIVPDKKLLAKGRIDVKEDQDVLLAVKDNENSIGFIGLNMVNPRFARAIAVDGIAPSRASLIDGTYPWKIQNSLILASDSSAAAKKFVDFILGDGRKLLHKDLVFLDEVKPAPAKKTGKGR